jgi:hypothetical protein
MSNVCSFRACGKPIVAKQLCRGHYAQRLHDKPLSPLRPRRWLGPCAFEECDRPAKTKGLCGAHYQQRRKRGTLRPLRPIASKEGACRFNDQPEVLSGKWEPCSAPRKRAGWCAGHVAQLYERRPLAPLRRPKRSCDFPGCSNPHYSLGYCRGHYRQRYEGRPLGRLRRKTGRYVDAFGYVRIYDPMHPNANKNGYVAPEPRSTSIPPNASGPQAQPVAQGDGR